MTCRVGGQLLCIEGVEKTERLGSVLGTEHSGPTAWSTCCQACPCPLLQRWNTDFLVHHILASVSIKCILQPHNLPQVPLIQKSILCGVIDGTDCRCQNNPSSRRSIWLFDIIWIKYRGYGLISFTFKNKPVPTQTLARSCQNYSVPLGLGHVHSGNLVSKRGWKTLLSPQLPGQDPTPASLV